MASAVRNQRWESATDLEERRTAIMRTLGEILRERHLSSLKMQDIADGLGMTKGNLYYYFRNKQDLLFHCHMKCMEQSLAALSEVADMAGSPTERLRLLLVKHVRSITDESYSAVLLTDLESLSAQQRRRYVALRDKFEKGVRSLIEEGVAIGEFAVTDVTTVGFAILGAINWISKWYNPKGPRNAGQIADVFADLFIRGLLPLRVQA